MKTYLMGLNSSIQSSYANNGKTTTFGRAFQKTLNGQLVLGASLSSWTDIFVTTALYPFDFWYNPNTGHLFVLSAASTTLSATNVWIMLFNVNSGNGYDPVYVGRVNLNFGNSAASAPTFKSFEVYENGSSITPVITLTGAVAVEGGKYIAWNLSAAQFTIGGSTIYAASGSGQTAMYFLQDPVAMGAAHAASSAWGGVLPMFSSTGAVNTKTLQANGTFALPQFYQWDLATTPTVASAITSGVNSLSGGYTVATYGTSVLTYLSTASSPVYYTTFTTAGISSGITAGATYTTGGITFTAQWAYVTGSLSIVMTSTSSSQVASSGTLTLGSGSGPATISYTGTSQVLLFNGYALGAGGDQTVVMAGTGAVPTGLTAWVANTLQTTSNVYFTRDVQLVYSFTTSATGSGITAGATYTITGAGVTLTCSITYGSGVTTVLMNTTNGATIPSSGTLTFASGTGPATITYSAQTSTLYFNLAATTGGVAVAVSQTVSSFTMIRAFGISSNAFVLKTGVMTAFTGGTLVANTMNYAKPVSSPANTSLQGQDCIAWQASTAFYMGKWSELTSGATTWPSLTTAGVTNTGTGTDSTAITTILGEYCGQGLSGDLDNFVYVSNGATFYLKPYRVPGLAFTGSFGGTNTTYYEGNNPVSVQAGLTAITNIHTNAGLLFVAGQTIGQRGFITLDMGSDATFGYSGVVSAVQNIPLGSVFKYVGTTEQDFDLTDSINFWVRSATTSTDAIFSSVTLPVGAPMSPGVTSNGWTCIKTAYDNSTASIAVGPYYQLCLTFDSVDLLANSPAQVADVTMTFQLPGEAADNWDWSNEHTSQSGVSPMVVSVRQLKAYVGTPTIFRLNGYDDSGNLAISLNTTSNPTAFQVTANNGSTYSAWSNMATFMASYNTALTTELKITISSPPAVTNLTWSFLDA